MRLAFDIEANGFLETVSQIHCIVCKDIDTGTIHKFTPNKVEQGCWLLMEADLVVGHNIIGYDLPVLSKIFPWFKLQEDKVHDTLVLSRLIFADLSNQDFDNKAPLGKLIGSHSLEAWGLRLGDHKLDYSGGWEAFSEEMLTYCVRDVEVTDRLYKHMLAQGASERAIDLEHQVAWIIAAQEQRGFCFDEDKARNLAAQLQSKLYELEQRLQDTFPPFYQSSGEVTPKKTTNGTKKPGTWAGASYTKVKLTTFNPASRHHIAYVLKRDRNWTPKEFTPSGQPQIDETILSKLTFPEAALLCDYFLVQKRLSLLLGQDGKGWLNLVRQGRVYGRCITNGAVTGRCTHQVIANLPRVSTAYGAEIRSLFTASPGRVQIGIDISGLELRMLAHFLAKWDDGAYGKVVCDGDIHTANMEAAELPTRDNAKTFIYGFLYGAGDVKVGTIVDPLATEAKQRKRGKELKTKFVARTPGLKQLLGAVGKAAERGFLIGLDGRRLRVRSTHAALNTLLQSAGALIAKRWIVELDMAVKAKGWSDKAAQLIFYHDEVQYEVSPDIADEFGKLAVECIQRAGDYFGIRVPLTGEFKIGHNWADCH